MQPRCHTYDHLSLYQDPKNQIDILKYDHYLPIWEVKGFALVIPTLHQVICIGLVYNHHP